MLNKIKYKKKKKLPDLSTALLSPKFHLIFKFIVPPSLLLSAHQYLRPWRLYLFPPVLFVAVGQMRKPFKVWFLHPAHSRKNLIKLKNRVNLSARGRKKQKKEWRRIFYLWNLLLRLLLNLLRLLFCACISCRLFYEGSLLNGPFFLLLVTLDLGVATLLPWIARLLRLMGFWIFSYQLLWFLLGILGFLARRWLDLGLSCLLLLLDLFLGLLFISLGGFLLLGMILTRFLRVGIRLLRLILFLGLSRRVFSSRVTGILLLLPGLVFLVLRLKVLLLSLLLLNQLLLGQ